MSDPHFESAVWKILNHQLLNDPIQLHSYEAICASHLKISQSFEITYLYNGSADQDESDDDEMSALL